MKNKLQKIALSLFILISLIVFNIRSSTNITTPAYEIEQQGLNNRITNSLSDFDGSAYIENEVNSFLQKWNLKGASVAIIKDEKLVYAHGFGIADVYGNEVQPSNIFRVASVSKLITAMGIMRLVEDRKLRLNQKVFGPGGILNNPVFNEVADKRLYRITVQQLLAHSAGWTQHRGDPAFSPLDIAKAVEDEAPATMYSYYKFVASRHLSYYPGTRYAYSNMGYMFLADVIAKVSGQPYEDYIRDKILIPNGILDMHIGASFQADKRHNEVNYWVHEDNDSIPCYDGSGRIVSKADGGNSIELLSSAGGWICSSIELAKLITLIDGEDFVPDIFTPETIAKMTNDVSTKGPLGWRSIYNNDTWVRTGNMAGTVAAIKRLGNGYTWVFLCNTSNWKGNKIERNIDFMMTNILRKTQSWPDQNLFDYFQSEKVPLANMNNKIFNLNT